MQDLEYPIYVFTKPIRTPISKYNLHLELEKLSETMNQLDFKKKTQELVKCILGTYFNELEKTAKELEYQLVKQTETSAVFYIWCDTEKSKILVEAVEHCNPMFLKGGIEKILELFTDSFKADSHPFHTLPIANILKQTLTPIEVSAATEKRRKGMTKFTHKIRLND